MLLIYIPDEGEKDIKKSIIDSYMDLEKEIKEIKERNTRVEFDKAWETSWARKIIIFVLTYFVIVVFFYAAALPDPFLNSVVPSLAFVISTSSLSFCKKWWLKRKS